MKRLQGSIRTYAWGSFSALPNLFGFAAADVPIAEVWLGAHPDGAARIISDENVKVLCEDVLYSREPSPCPDGLSLHEYIARDSSGVLGETVARRYKGKLPYLLKLIAPREALSLQVHPNIEQAREGFTREENDGIDRVSAQRNYRDSNHKPELVYALTRFEALAGFRTVRRVRELLSGLDSPLARELIRVVDDGGVVAAFRYLLSEQSRPSPQSVDELAQMCVQRELSPSPRVDMIVGRLARLYPGDPGVVASLLLNPVTLQPGESLYIPAGMVHAYLEGTGVEIMAASDNVVRAGLTKKHIDVPELLRIVDTSAAPPIRIAPEHMSSVMSTFYVPIDDFELSVIRLRDASRMEAIRTTGPRTLLCLEGAAQVHIAGGYKDVNVGQALFIPHSDGRFSMRGFGHFVLASVP